MLIIKPGVAGLGAASAAIISLQQALLGLSQASGLPAIHPGPVDGLLGPMTMSAVASGLQVVATKLPQDATMAAINVAFASGASTAQAKTAVNTYASQLTTLIRATTLTYTTGGAGAQSTAPMPRPPVVYVTRAPGVDVPSVVVRPPATSASPSTSSSPPASSISPWSSSSAKPWYTQWWGIAAIGAGALGVYFMLTSKKTATASAAGN